MFTRRAATPTSSEVFRPNSEIRAAAPAWEAPVETQETLLQRVTMTLHQGQEWRCMQQPPVVVRGRVFPVTNRKSGSSSRLGSTFRNAGNATAANDGGAATADLLDNSSR